MLKQFLADEQGATALEHALVAAFVVLAALAAVGLTGAKLYAAFDSIALGFSGGSSGDTPR